MKKILLFIFVLNSVLFFCSFKSFAQQAKTFSLAQAQEYAVKNGYTTKSANLEVQTSIKKVWEMTAMGLPQIRGSISYQDMLDIPTTLIPDFISPAVYGVLVHEKVKDGSGNTIEMPAASDQYFAAKFGTQHNANLNASLSQLIFSGDYILGLQAAKIFKQMSEQNYVKSEIEIKLSVAKSYYMVLIVRENKRLLDSSLNLLNKTAFDIKQMNKQGFIDTTDLEQIMLTVATIKNTIATLERQENLSKMLLNFQMGIDIEQPIELTDELYSIVDQVNPATLSGQKFDLGSNIDYTIISTAEKLAWLNVRRERYLYYPSLSASLNYAENAMRSEFNFFDFSQDWYPTSILGFSLNIPIFNSGMKHARVQQAIYQFQKSGITKKQVEQGLLLEYNQSKSDFVTAYEKYLTLKDNMVLAENIYKRTLIKYREGVSSSMELTQAQNQYFTVQGNYINAMFDLLNNKSKLDKILSKNQ
jgi:outer membrane protein